MIEYIKGKVATLTPAYAVLENSVGMGYRVYISLATFSALQGKSDATLLIHENIREDGWTLFGFATERERELFRLLIGVSGVGAATAVLMLSALPDHELTSAIASGDAKRLKAVKGIGAKTAERIIVDLRDKIEDTATAADLSHTTPQRAPGAYDEALAALVMLGFDRKQSTKALDAIFDADPSLKVEAAIKKALSMIK